MGTNNDGGPAFPTLGEYTLEHPEPGMSLRDYFAGLALAPLITTAAPELRRSTEYQERTALTAYRWADAMLKARVVEI